MFFYPCVALTSLTMIWAGTWLGALLMAAGLLAALTLGGLALRGRHAAITYTTATIDRTADQATVELPDAA